MPFSPIFSLVKLQYMYTFTRSSIIEYVYSILDSSVKHLYISILLANILALVIIAYACI